MKTVRTLSLFLATALLASCGGGSGGQSDPNGPDASQTGPDASAPADAGATDAGGDSVGETLSMVSVPPTFVVADSKYTYRPSHSGVGDANWSLPTAPTGMTVNEGRLEWTPDASMVGSHDVVLSGSVDGVQLSQRFEIVVSAKTLRASQPLVAGQAAQLAVDAPLSSIRGASIQVPSGALPSDVQLQISEISNSPNFPNKTGELKAVDFGPDGLVFQHSPTISLPFDPTTTADPSKVGAYVYNEDMGRWEPVEVVNVDAENGVVVAKASHFSIYAAAETSLDFVVKAELLGSDSIAEGRVALYAELESDLSSVDVTSVNNLSDDMKALGATNVAELALHSSFVGSLRVVRVMTLHEDGVSSTRIVVGTLYVNDQGATVTLTDSFGNVIGQFTYDDHRTSWDEVSAHLRGLSSHAFADEGFGSGAVSASARMHFVYSSADASYLGGAADTLGAAAVEIPQGAAGAADVAATGFDVDADRLRGGYDTFDDSLEPKLEVSPTEAVTVMAGTSVQLRATVADSNNPPSSTTWEVVAGDGLLVAVDGAPNTRSFSTSTPGFHTVRFSAEADDKSLSSRFNIQVLPKPVANTAPTCQPTALVTTVEEGRTVTIFAVVDDAETPNDALTIEWGLAFDTGTETLFVPSSSIAGEGQVVGFTAHSAGTYSIGCRAFDGEVWGEMNSTQVGVVAADVNQAPVDFFVSPASAQTVVGDTIKFQASAKDPDGDVLTYSWIHSFGAAATQGATSNGSTLTVDTTSVAPGTYSLLASVEDGNAPAQFLPATLRVLAAPVPPSAVDGDNDGFPSDLDCNDADPKINPDQHEICGNDVDEDCDGVKALDDCDGDGFDSSMDCNDADPKVHPEASELCDGRDNNCDGFVDENWAIGESCTNGLGVCANTGTIKCAPDQVNSVCQAQPLPSSAETCDSLDNDCDGVVDDGDICTAEKLGRWFPCAEPEPGDDPDDFANCARLDRDGFELAQDGKFALIFGGDPNTPDGYFDPTTPFCVLHDGTFVAQGNDMEVRFPGKDGATETHQVTFEVNGDLGSLTQTDPDTGATEVEDFRRVHGVYGNGACPEVCEPEFCDGVDNDCDGMVDEDNVCGGTCSCNQGPGCDDGCSCDPECSDWCDHDDDGDGVSNCQDPCPDDPNPECAPPVCDNDGKDNNGDGVIDETGEPCGPPLYCDQDGVDNNGDGTVDEPGEPCEHMVCDQDGIDNNGDGVVDEPGEPCNSSDWCQFDQDGDGIPNCEDPCPDNNNPQCGQNFCETDGIDNNNNGTVDEPKESCHSTCEFDNDGDGVNNCEDSCPNNASPSCAARLCDTDGVDNDGDGTVDESGEECPPLLCEDDGIDNNGNGIVDEALELCHDQDGLCNTDGIDNDGDGTVDESDEKCPDPCMGDEDGDGINNCEDACPFNPSATCDACTVDDDRDDFPNCEDPCPHEPGFECGGGPMYCDQDGIDNDGNGIVDEPGEYCGPPMYCDQDGIDNDGNGIVDEPGEYCGSPMYCDQDGIDNDGNGIVDEPGEYCGSPMYCDQDGVDNNGDGTVDEPGEPCEHMVCDQDGIDNDGNGTVDEPGEPCNSSDWCQFDQDGDGILNCEDPCPDNNNLQCGQNFCETDGVDNNGDGTIDEPKESCHSTCEFDNDGDGVLNCDDACPNNASPSCAGKLCDTDGVDNDGDGSVDEAGEECPPLLCENDGIDNNGDGTVDEALELCHPEGALCNTDGIDNDGDGVVDESDEMCPDPCMGDEDGDGVYNCEDACPFNPSATCDPCTVDDDRDDFANCDDPCPHEPGFECGGGPMYCDQDGIDNNGDGTVDEPGEPCEPPLYCDNDGVDNNGDGTVDEPGEACGSPMYCDTDGIDNNGDGTVDEPGEPCEPPLYCDNDGIDNNNDGTIDELGELCAP